VVLVDDEDADLLERSWSVRTSNRHRHAFRTEPVSGGAWQTVYLHRLVARRMGIDDSRLIDHRNRNGLDCQRGNLRPANHGQNMANTSHRPGRERMRGVYPVSGATNRWRAQIGVSYRKIALGSYGSIEEAARAYDRGALQHFGEFAVLNYPPEVLAPAPAPESIWSDDEESPF
jgi:hypothetical protein